MRRKRGAMDFLFFKLIAILLHGRPNMAPNFGLLFIFKERLIFGTSLTHTDWWLVNNNNNKKIKIWLSG